MQDFITDLLPDTHLRGRGVRPRQKSRYLKWFDLNEKVWIHKQVYFGHFFSETLSVS